MGKLVFRNDDVNPSTDFEDLGKKYLLITKYFPRAEIISVVSLIGKMNPFGSVYENVPFKDMPVNNFYDVDSILRSMPGMSRIASHGLFHVDHTKISKDAQEMSIISSCKLLETDIFVPPFNRWNADTLMICAENNVNLIRAEQGWKSLEFNKFDENHDLWYFHSWKYNVKEFERALNGLSVNVG